MNHAQRNAQSGFGLGMILLIVIIIAAVVAAIAFALRGGGSSGERERARTDAGTITAQANDIDVAIRRLVANGVPNKNLIIFAEDKDIAPDTCAALPAVCLFDVAEGDEGGRPVPPRTAFEDGTIRNWSRNYVDPEQRRLPTTVNIPGVGRPNGEMVMYLTGLKDAVCKQINALANQTVPTDPQPQGAPGIDTEAQGGVIDLAALANPAWTDGWRSGCYYDTQLNTNVFVRVFEAN